MGELPLVGVVARPLLSRRRSDRKALCIRNLIQFAGDLAIAMLLICNPCHNTSSRVRIDQSLGWDSGTLESSRARPRGRCADTRRTPLPTCRKRFATAQMLIVALMRWGPGSVN